MKPSRAFMARHSTHPHSRGSGRRPVSRIPASPISPCCHSAVTTPPHVATHFVAAVRELASLINDNTHHIFNSHTPLSELIPSFTSTDYAFLIFQGAYSPPPSRQHCEKPDATFFFTYISKDQGQGNVFRADQAPFPPSLPACLPRRHLCRHHLVALVF